MDISADSSWKEVPEARKEQPEACFNVGFLLGKNKGNLYLSASVDPENARVSDRSIIPLSVVKKIVRLNPHLSPEARTMLRGLFKGE
jgi:hypothetical protein